VFTSCAALDPLSILKPDKPSLELNANVGKNVEQEKNNIKLEQGNKEVKQEAEVISNDTSYTAEKIETINQDIPMEYMILLVFVAGWAIPDIKQTFKGLEYVIEKTLHSFLVRPFKGIADFVLKLFGRID
jgi:hypothetical protein